MLIDKEKIIKDTVRVFNQSLKQKEKFNNLKSYIEEKEYNELHKEFLTPIDIKIDCELFTKEIERFSNSFEQWGTQHSHLPRFGLAVVNQDGNLKNNDPINGSLYEWNNKNPDDPIIESDCVKPTEVLNMQSLSPLAVFNQHWCRSNILKWHTGAEFKPHIDTVIPSPWLRLWGTTNAERLDLRYDNGSGTLVKFDNIESGRIYLIDTSIVHDAHSYDDNIYQFFLSVLPSSINILKDLLCPD